MIIPFLKTFFLAMFPLAELRVAIPIGHLQWDLPMHWAILAGVLGTLLAVSVMIKLLPFLVKILRKIDFFDKFLDKLFHKTRQKHSQKFIIWGEIFLIFFVAVPIPGSGGFMAGLIAFLFDLPYWKSLFFIGVGLILAGLIMGGLTVGGDQLFHVFWR